MNKHIILVGFKNVGKSLVGKNVSAAMDIPFVDSDKVLEDMYAERTGTRLSCREIMRKEGEQFFRDLEHEALAQALSAVPPAVISVGGGAPFQEKNQQLFTAHNVVHITAPKGVVFERIMLSGWPAFFPREVDPYLSFQKIWADRMPHYEKLATVTVENSGAIEDTVAKLVELLKSQS